MKWSVLLAISVAGLAFRLWLIFGAGSAASPEVFEYDDIARNLLAGQGYVHTHLGTPYRSFYSGIFYIWLTAGLYAIFPWGQAAVLVAQSLISSVLAVVIFFIGRILWSQRAGLWAAGLTVSHPALVYYDTHKLHPLSFDSFTTSLVVLALLWAFRARHAFAPLLAGGVLGVAVLQRGSLLLLIPLGFLWLWIFGPKDGHSLRHWVGYLLGIMLVMGPWLARNYMIHQTPLLVTTTAQYFWLGNAPHSYGSNLLPSGQAVLDAAPQLLRDDLLSRDEWGQAQLFWRSGLANMWAHPWAFLLGISQKFLYFWTFGPQMGLLYPRSYFYLYAAYYFAAVALAVLGAACLAGASSARSSAFPGLLLILAVFLSVSATHSVLYFELRHRWAIEPMLLVFSAVGLWTVWPRMMQPRLSAALR